MLGTYKKGPVCGMRAALSRRHVHGLRFQPPATGDETGRKRTRDSDEFSGADTTGEMKAKIDRDMTCDRKKAKCTPVKPEACSDPDATSVMPREKPDLVKFYDLCRHLQFSWDENCFDRYQASIEACTAEQQQILKSIRDRKVNQE